MVSKQSILLLAMALIAVSNAQSEGFLVPNQSRSLYANLGPAGFRAATDDIFGEILEKLRPIFEKVKENAKNVEKANFDDVRSYATDALQQLRPAYEEAQDLAAQLANMKFEDAIELIKPAINDLQPYFETGKEYLHVLDGMSFDEAKQAVSNVASDLAWQDFHNIVLG